MDELEQLKIENAELKQKLETRRFETFTNCLYLVNILAITTQKWDGWLLLYFFSAELVGLFIWIFWAAFWDSRES
ncbi:hypothetical protein [Acidaminococcus timonensis]|uniref:hypothetical protein n=1 Tax=uncultured Acidaminococcus sp. TaxID=352152 RepID=UPI0025912C9A|nr:hypothetical protein [uncultured Acidaminococcus sp.]